jgi:hypothetical protein
VHFLYKYALLSVIKMILYFQTFYSSIESPGSSFSIVIGYRMDDQVPISGRGREEIYSLHHRVQTGCGAHPVSYSMGRRGFFPGGETPRA